MRRDKGRVAQPLLVVAFISWVVRLDLPVRISENFRTTNVACLSANRQNLVSHCEDDATGWLSYRKGLLETPHLRSATSALWRGARASTRHWQRAGAVRNGRHVSDPRLDYGDGPPCQRRSGMCRGRGNVCTTALTGGGAACRAFPEGRDDPLGQA